MFAFMNNCKGAISIFLLIVMVPMLTVSSLFVDMSRIKLAEAVADSSGDLTLNTALTNYDAVLKDMYGLFATSQDTDELFENLEDYYRQCIESAGIALPDEDDFVENIMEFVKSASGYDDILNMDLISFEIEKPTGGNLANPALLKSQIIDFMKYRAPINLGTGILEALGSFKNMKKQNKLVEDKKNFYSEQTDMLSRLEKIWGELEDYQYKDAFPWGGGPGTESIDAELMFPQGKYLKLEVGHLDEIYKKLEKTLPYLVRYTYFTADLEKIFDLKIECVVPDDDDKYSEIWYVNAPTRDQKKELAAAMAFGVEKNGDTGATLDDLKDVLNTAFKRITEWPHDFDDDPTYSLLSKVNTTGGLTDSNFIRLWAACADGALSKPKNGYFGQVRNLVIELVALKNMQTSLKDENNKYNVDYENTYVTVVKNEDGTKTLKYGTEKTDNSAALDGFINDQLTHLGGQQKDGTVNYSDEITGYNDLVRKTNNHINYDGYGRALKEKVAAAKKLLENDLYSARAHTVTFYFVLDQKCTRLKNAYDALATIKADLENKDSEYNKTLKAWKSSAGDLSDDSIGKSSAEEIAKVEKILTVDKVDSLITRLKNAYASMDALRTKVANIKIAGISWKDLDADNPYSQIIKKLTDAQKKKINSIGSGEQRFDKVRDYKGQISYSVGDAESVVTELLGASPFGTFKTEWKESESEQNPDLTKSQRELYTWMYNNFYDEARVKSKYYKEGNYRGDGKVDSTKGDTGTVTPTKDLENNKGSAEGAKDEGQKKAEKYNGEPTPQGTSPDRKLKDYTNQNNLPSKKWVEEKKELKNQESNSGTTNEADTALDSTSGDNNLLSQIIKLAEDIGITLRDNLYITDYIMNMFSYSTFEQEIMVENKDSVSATEAFGSWYEKKDGSDVYTLTESFSSNAKKAQMLKDARTLTNVSINPNSNFLYGQEVEYIIYGENGIEKTYGTIYLLRFALNTIYAFTDAEIGNITLSAATALFGVPPLTPLIPLAQIAMTLGFALAESAYDLYTLKCGEKLPLIKSSDTWVMKPSSALKKVVGEVAEVVVDKAVDLGVEKFNEFIEMSSDKLQEYIDDGEESLKEISDSAFEKTKNELNNYANQAVQKLLSICNDINSELTEKAFYDEKGNAVLPDLGYSDEKMDQVIERLDKWLASQKESDSEAVYLVKKAAVDLIKEKGEDVVKGLFKQIEKSRGAGTQEEKITISNEINKILTELKNGITGKINGLIDEGGNAISKLKDDLLDELKDAASEGAEKLKSKMKEKIGDVFGGSEEGVTKTDSVVSSLLSWAYSDYLQLFLLVGLVVSTDTIMLRTADVIQMNMNLIKNNPSKLSPDGGDDDSRLGGLDESDIKDDSEFLLSKSYTYLGIKARIDVKPMLINMALVSDQIGGELDESPWYSISYSGQLGY